MLVGHRPIIHPVVLCERATGLTDADRAKIASDARQFDEIADLAGGIVGPIFFRDGKAAQTVVPLDLGPEGWARAADVVSAMRQVVQAGGNGLSAWVTGPAGSAADSSKAFEGIDSTLLLGTISIVVLIVLLTYRSPTLWLLPVVSAGVALTCAQAAIFLFGQEHRSDRQRAIPGVQAQVGGNSATNLDVHGRLGTTRT